MDGNYLCECVLDEELTGVGTECGNEAWKELPSGRFVCRSCWELARTEPTRITYREGPFGRTHQDYRNRLAVGAFLRRRGPGGERAQN